MEQQHRQTQPFDAWKQEGTRELVRRGSMTKPIDAIAFPHSQNITNQVNQLRVNGIPQPVSTLRNPRPESSLPAIPKTVGTIRSVKTAIPGTSNVRVNLSFTRDPADPAFQSANVYLKQGINEPNLVAVTQGTQASFVVAKSSATAVVTVQSVGTSGSTPIARSPSKAINVL